MDCVSTCSANAQMHMRDIFRTMVRRMAWISKITNNWILYNKSYVAYIYTRYEYTTKAIRQSTTADEPSSMPYALNKISYT